jgi:hypothetical protein
MAVALGQHAEDLQAADHLLHHHALLGQQAIDPALLGAQWASRRLAVGRRARGMQALDPLVALVRQQGCLGRDGRSRALEEREIVLAPLAYRQVEDALAVDLDEDLALESVPLLLAAVVGPLLFLGRSTAVSATSTTTASAAARSARLPGKAKRPDRTSASSTRRTMRQAVASCTPQLCAW